MPHPRRPAPQIARAALYGGPVRQLRLQPAAAPRGSYYSPMTDARRLLTALINRPITTITHEKTNCVLAVDGLRAEVMREQRGAVPVAHVQQALDALYRDGELRIDKRTLGHSNTAFVGAVLAQLPDVESLTNPQRVRVSR